MAMQRNKVHRVPENSNRPSPSNSIYDSKTSSGTFGPKTTPGHPFPLAFIVVCDLCVSLNSAPPTITPPINITLDSTPPTITPSVDITLNSTPAAVTPSIDVTLSGGLFGVWRHVD
jgi:hypothetical protein